MAGIVENAHSIIIDSRFRKQSEEINNILYTFSPPLRNCTGIRISDISILRTQFIVTNKSLRFVEVQGQGQNVTNTVSATDLTSSDRDQELARTTQNIQLIDCDVSAQDIANGLGALMTNLSLNHWTYTVKPSGKISVTDPSNANPNPTFILEPTSNATFVTDAEFRDRMNHSVLYELGFDLRKVFSGSSTYSPDFPTRCKGDESIFVRLFVNGTERGDLLFCTNDGSSLTCFGRLTLMTNHFGTAYCMGLPYTAHLENEQINQFSIQLCRLTLNGLEPYETRGQDYSGLVQIFTGTKKLR